MKENKNKNLPQETEGAGRFYKIFSCDLCDLCG
jgi:hypothetical protein